MVDSVQDTYEDGIPGAAAGLLFGVGPKDVQGLTVLGSNLRYGAAVIKATGDNDNTCRLPDDGNQLGNGATVPATDVFAGISVLEHVFEQRGALAALASPIGNGETSSVLATQTASVLTLGEMWVLVEVAVSRKDPVFFRRNAGTNLLPLGGFSNVAGANVELIPNATFESSAGAGEFARVKISTPVSV